ncbi:hypothetical protein GCM10009091_40040 [Pseudomonas brenneri]|nr:hypothetical protein GCM10009091_40040 [Pseudomonas brenneri]
MLAIAVYQYQIYQLTLCYHGIAKQIGLLWRAGLSERRIVRAGLRSSPKTSRHGVSDTAHSAYWGCFAAQRGWYFRFPCAQKSRPLGAAF